MDELTQIKAELATTKAQVEELLEWKKAREQQQIAFPIDEASLSVLGTPVSRGAGATALTQSITIGAGGGSADVPKAYIDTIILEIDGVKYEIPYIGLP